MARRAQQILELRLTKPLRLELAPRDVELAPRDVEQPAQPEQLLPGVVTAAPRDILALRRGTLGYVSQFLRVVPRVSTLDVVAEPLMATGSDRATAEAQAKTLLHRLNIPERLWQLSPTTFSGGEQQRVNIARGFAYPYPALLLD